MIPVSLFMILWIMTIGILVGVLWRLFIIEQRLDMYRSRLVPIQTIENAREYLSRYLATKGYSLCIEGIFFYADKPLLYGKERIFLANWYNIHLLSRASLDILVDSQIELLQRTNHKKPVS